MGDFFNKEHILISRRYQEKNSRYNDQFLITAALTQPK
jgi:hypothetical protein